MAGRDIGLGVIGCGGFGLYAVENFVQTPGVRLVALTDISKEAASTASEMFRQRFGISWATASPTRRAFHAAADQDTEVSYTGR